MSGPYWPATLTDEARAAHDERESEYAAEAERAERCAEHAPGFPLPHPSAPSTPTATGERRVVPDEVPPGVISAPGSAAALCGEDTSDGPHAATGRRAAVDRCDGCGDTGEFFAHGGCYCYFCAACPMCGAAPNDYCES